MIPSGQSRSLHGFFAIPLGFGMDAKGRSGREVGKNDFLHAGGTGDIDAPMPSGDGAEGRECIMTGIWRVDGQDGWPAGEERENENDLRAGG